MFFHPPEALHLVPTEGENVGRKCGELLVRLLLPRERLEDRSQRPKPRCKHGVNAGGARLRRDGYGVKWLWILGTNWGLPSAFHLSHRHGAILVLSDRALVIRLTCVSLTGLKSRSGGRCFSRGSGRESVSLPFPPCRGHPHAVAHGPFLPLRMQQRDGSQTLLPPTHSFLRSADSTALVRC